jgi:hypothetical protein
MHGGMEFIAWCNTHELAKYSIILNEECGLKTGNDEQTRSWKIIPLYFI